MPLSSGKPILKSDLVDAYKWATEEGSKDTEAQSDIIGGLADRISKAVHEYMETALVQTEGVINPGQMTSFAGSYATPGDTIGQGTISFGNTAVKQLREGIKKALENATDNGAKDGADPDQIISDLALDMKDCIYAFAIEAKVETTVTIVGGATVAGSIVGGATVPSVSSPGTGKGKGGLS